MKKILLVDDDVASSKLISASLKSRGYTVVCEHDGRAGLKRILMEKPDLVILDILMPKMTGYQVMEQIRALPSTLGKVPIIVMSAKESLSRSFSKADIHAFIPKPFEPEVLINEIDILLKHRSTSKGKEPVEAKQVADKKKGTVVATGVDIYIFKKIRQFFESEGYHFIDGYDEKDTVAASLKYKPDFIFLQYWEDPEKFPTLKLYQTIRDNNQLAQIPCFIYCLQSLEVEASKTIPRERLIAFKESADLCEAIQKCLSAQQNAAS